MPSWEEIRSKIDAEFNKLHDFFDAEMRPQTQKFLVQSLRSASSGLAKQAEEIDTMGEHKERRAAGTPGSKA